MTNHHDPSLRAARDRASCHRAELTASAMCGCFYCCTEFEPDQIREWVDQDAQGVGQTALCPSCGVDAVIGSASGYPLTQAFLQQMHGHWFGAAAG